MSRSLAFIEKYLALYLSECRIRNPFIATEHVVHIPPSSEEIEELISYLLGKNTNPVIIGSIAVIKHLHVTKEDIIARRFRPTKKLELLVSQELLPLLTGWQLNKDSTKAVSWISPTGGIVDFFTLKDIFPEDIRDQNIIKKDAESVDMGCPIADVQTIFLIKLNSTEERDLLDLLMLVSRQGIPKDLDKCLWTARQKKNLEFIKLWMKNKQDI